MLLALAACQQPTSDRVDDRACPELPLAQGEVWAGQMVCRDQRFVTGGEGRAIDYWLANSRFRAILRHPLHALTQPGLGGGTIIDAAPWGRQDPLHEIVPLVEGGWLQVDDLTVGADSLTLHGELTSWPDGPPSPSAGERRSVTWQVRPDDPWLYLEGTDGLWIHPRSELDLLDGWLWANRAVIGHDGTSVEDLGGAIRVLGASRVLIAEPADALAVKSEQTQEIGGAAPGATEVRLFRGETHLGTLPVVDEVYAGVVPADVDAVQSFAPGFAASLRSSPGPSMALPIGAEATLDLRIAWQDATPRPVRLRWTSADGRSGQTKLDPLGERVALGAGVHELRLDAGPTVRGRSLRVELPPGTNPTLTARMEALFDPGPHIYASLAWPGSRDATVRDTEEERSREAMLRGMAFVVSTSDNVASSSATYISDGAWIRTEAGATVVHPDGWQVGAWPWNDAPRQPGYGVPAVRDLDPLRSLGLAWGGVGLDRKLAPSLSWYQALDLPPWAFDPQPEYVDLPSPGQPPFLRWQTWYDWLDAGRFLLPMGPRHWLDVEDVDRYGPVDIERAIVRGTFSTGTGALVDLLVEDAGPGTFLEPAPGASRPLEPQVYPVRVEVRPAQTTVQRAAIVTSGGIVATWDVDEDTPFYEAELPLLDWAVAITWSDSTADWAVTAPVWTWPPGGRSPLDTGTDSADTAPETAADTAPETADSSVE